MSDVEKVPSVVDEESDSESIASNQEVLKKPRRCIGPDSVNPVENLREPDYTGYMINLDNFEDISDSIAYMHSIMHEFSAPKPNNIRMHEVAAPRPDLPGVSTDSKSLAREAGSSKRMRTDDDDESPLFVKEARSRALVNIVEYYKLSSEMNVAMLIALSRNGELIPIIIKLDEPSLLAWLQSVSSASDYQKWFEEWKRSEQSVMDTKVMQAEFNDGGEKKEKKVEFNEEDEISLTQKQELCPKRSDEAQPLDEELMDGI